MSSDQTGQESRQPSGNGAAPGNPGQTASRTVDSVRDGIASQAEAQKHEAADSAQHAADAARQAARNLQGNEAWMAGLVERGADQLADFANTLRSNDLNALLGRAQEFARGQPVLFTGAAVALGFALTRAARVAAARPSAAKAEHDADVAKRHTERREETGGY